MAKVFGKPSKYLSGKERRYRKIAKLALYVVVILAAYVLGTAIKTVTSDQDDGSKIWSFAVFGIIYLLIIWRVLVYYSRSEWSAGKFLRGEQGEDSVCAILNTLSSDYYWLWRDLKIDYGNIDCVVARRNQIFSIEIKNVPGRIGFDGYQLTKNGNRMKDGDYLQQTQREVIFLRKYLARAFGHQIPIVPIIVFAHKSAWIDFDFKKPIVNGIYVLPGRLVKGFIEYFPDSHMTLNMPLLEELLGRLVETK